MNVTNTSSPQSGRITAIIYAPPGYGKTTLAGTLKGRTLILSAEAGLLALRGRSIDVLVIDSYNSLMDALVFLNQPETKDTYQNVFVDSLTEISQRVIERLKVKFPDHKDGLRLWGEYSEQMMFICKELRDMTSYNVFITALSKIDKDENNVRYNCVDVNGKIGERLPALFDLVLPLVLISNEEGNDERKLLTCATGKYVAKDRSGKLDPLEPPNLQDLLDKILNPLN